MCWYGSLCVQSKRVLSDVLNVCSKVVGAKQVGMQELYKKKVKQILNNESCFSTVYQTPIIWTPF